MPAATRTPYTGTVYVGRRRDRVEGGVRFSVVLDRPGSAAMESRLLDDEDTAQTAASVVADLTGAFLR